MNLSLVVFEAFDWKQCFNLRDVVLSIKAQKSCYENLNILAGNKYTKNVNFSREVMVEKKTCPEILLEITAESIIIENLFFPLILQTIKNRDNKTT